MFPSTSGSWPCTSSSRPARAYRSLQLSKEIGVKQKTAWFILGRLREACGGDIDKLDGIIEVDETYIGGKEKNNHADK